ncbi:unnamed protein product, partial [Discosporangium mesarthrocarpum]
MVISRHLLGASYSVTQYSGAAVVAVGIIVVLGPSLSSPSPWGGDAGGGGQEELLWSVVMVLSCVPMALSSVYKEIALGESELDPIYLNGRVRRKVSWIAVFQFLLAIPLAFPAALALDPPISPVHLPKNLWDGWRCYLGYDSIFKGDHQDHCWPGGALYVTLYLGANMCYNVLVILVRTVGGGRV